jgi:hypothetical protein
MDAQENVFFVGSTPITAVIVCSGVVLTTKLITKAREKSFLEAFSFTCLCIKVSLDG